MQFQTLLLFFMVLSPTALFAQNPDAMHHTWELYSVRIDGGYIEIPEETITIQFLEEGQLGASDYSFTTNFCGELTADITYSNTIEYTLEAQNLVDDPCGNPDDDSFQDMYFDFLSDEDETFKVDVIYLGSYMFLWLTTPYSETEKTYEFVDSEMSVAAHENTQIQIYPNPTDDYLIIEGLQQPADRISVYSLSGKRIPVLIENNRVDVSNLAIGAYIVSITTNEGQKTFRKFIKK